MNHALDPFGESVFSVYSRLAREADAVNLGQGFPDFDGPEWIQDAARDAMRRGLNQYALGHGAHRLRAAIATDVETRMGVAYDPETEVTVTTGATEGIAAAMIGLLNPGDEVLTFEPFYDSYPACAAIAGASLDAVTLHAPDFRFDPDELAAAFTPRTRLFVLNTPHNPTGRVFSRDEIGIIVELCREYDCLILTDEVYEHLVFDGAEHLSPAQLDKERTLRLSSGAKTFSLTGWKVGWACGAKGPTAALRRAHQFLVFSTAAPLQDAIAVALEESPGRGYYETLRAEYTERRTALLEALSGFEASPPEGTYFAMARVDEDDSAAFVRRMIKDQRVAAIPPQTFYAHPERANGLVRFAFCKTVETIREAGKRLASTG
ncbi:MAG: aminotransferase class I/II-fold pyridoxal phosphate-dependent enzyme [Planctomycetota bacterium]